MSASTNFFSTLLRIDMAMSPMYECWGFGSSGKGILNSRGSSLARGNMARSGGGANLGARGGTSSGGNGEKGCSIRIRSAKARVYRC